MTKIVEKFFDQPDFSQREQEVLEKVCNQTGFEVEKLIFTGAIYEPDKVGSLIYKGRYEGKPAVLKLQGLEPDIEEIDIIIGFDRQNQSQKVRLPKLYRFQHWDKDDGYGYLITEYIDAPNIYIMPYATDAQKQQFCDLYQEYRINTTRIPFVPKPEESACEFILRRVDLWFDIAKARGNLAKRLEMERVKELIDRYKQVMSSQLTDLKMVFCHAHLTANDIFVGQDGNFILLSNLYWAYRPQFYDLVFGLHFNIENLRDPNLDLAGLENFINDWLARFYKIPVVKNDQDARRKIALMLFERNMGGIIQDTGSRPKDDQFANQLLKLRIQLFDRLEQEFK